uniref:interferon-induced, double-stranded RNA-activated protein kinase-like n=1 Tax=Monopterus albus TaxID=43700 RepID=UPI0009B42BD8|nr:interferon-induced, double-stranded RNA-activated protein kinase-like [Monopterus albus]
MEGRNYVGELHEHAQKNNLKLRYDLDEVGPDHMKTFTQKVVLDGVTYPEGEGKTKKEAKCKAAKNALQCIRENKEKKEDQDSVVSTENAAEASSYSSRTGSPSVNSKDSGFTETDFIGIVNHYCQKTKCSYSFFEDRKCGPPHDPQFCYKLVINDKEYPVGEGKSAKEAKQNAAKLAWSALQEQSDWDSKVSSRSTVSEDGAPPPTPSNEVESSESSAQSVSASASDSVIFTSSSNTSKSQVCSLIIVKRIKVGYRLEATLYCKSKKI